MNILISSWSEVKILNFSWNFKYNSINKINNSEIHLSMIERSLIYNNESEYLNSIIIIKLNYYIFLIDWSVSTQVLILCVKIRFVFGNGSNISTNYRQSFLNDICWLTAIIQRFLKFRNSNILQFHLHHLWANQLQISWPSVMILTGLNN